MNIRQETKKYIEKNGSKKSWFCKQMGICQAHFSLFLKGERNLSEKREKILLQILDAE